MDTPLIDTHELRKEYALGDHVVHALRGVSVTIAAGEMVAVMGPSGSGKSTFMTILGCLDTPTAGRYLLEGRDVAGLDDDELSGVRNRRIGFVFQQFNLLPRITAHDTVVIPLSTAKKRVLGVSQAVPARSARSSSRSARHDDPCRLGPLGSVHLKGA